jgi:putative ABC transport system permease protein
VVSGLSALDRKLLRDLWRLRSQALAIAMVIASGVALLIMSLTTVEALDETMRAYYERYRFAQVFAEVKRAPERLAGEIADIPGVLVSETRIQRVATLDIAGFAEPVTGRMVSLPEGDQSRLNRLVLRSGRMLAPGRAYEAIVSEPFAEAHGLVPGDHFSAILNGRKRELVIAGTALSPEFIYTIAPGGLMPDDARFGVIWMNREALAAAFDMDEAFNSVSLTLLRGTDPQAVIERLDTLLATYGGIGAYDRGDQLSNWFLQNEISQQENMAGILPVIFLAVAGFLTAMVMRRLIATERSEIGLLKAFGYSDLAIGWHYAKLVAAIAGLGVLLGFAAGAWLGQFNTTLYADYYRFPFLLYRPGAQSFAIAGTVSIAVALLGSFGAVRQAMTLPPAEAMRPPAPPSFHRSRLADLGIVRALDEPTRMILRRILRWPLRAFLAASGVAMSLGVLLVALQWSDSIDHLVEEFFFRAQHQDATVSLVESRPARVRHDLAALPGVLSVETSRIVSARLRNGALSRRQAVVGIAPGAHLSPIRDVSRGVLAPPEAGVLLSSTLAEALELSPGDTVTVEVLEGRRPVRDMVVADVVESYIGTPVYMRLDRLNRLLGDSPQIDIAHLRIDSTQEAEFFAALKETPQVSGISLRTAAVDIFRDTLAETIYIFIGFFVAFSCTLAFGVVYNTVRIALSENARELATLRVLGFTRAEISYILLGETGFLAIAALPLGLAFGAFLSWYLSEAFSTELYRVPLRLEDATMGVAVLIVLATVVACAAIVRRRLDHLDLIAVLKTRE